ncbi:MAG: Fic family protein [Rickettsiaceae bacterium]|nr:Fic family protein [Rickettsiaceae bacterium]
MQNRIGKFITKKVAGESYKIYIPPKLPLHSGIDLNPISTLIENAAFFLSQLNSIAESIPNTNLFVYMYVRKEALLSSQIEGTQSSFSDLILFEHKQKPQVSLDDVEEVSNYVKAINHGIKRLKKGFPLCNRLICEVHKILLSGIRGTNKLPGKFRTSQNWIGGTRPGNAIFVPPAPEFLPECLSNLEKFLHDNTYPALIKAAITHLQFETIHPFLDGNGRIGRLLIILLLINDGIIEKPILYLSLYLKQNRSTYYNLLQEVRTNGTWETWLEFFLDSIITSSKQAILTINKINNLFTVDLLKIDKLGRASHSCRKVLEYLQELPQISVPTLSQALNISAPAARNALNHLTQLDITQEITGKKRDKIYVYKNYLTLLEDGTEPLSL